MKINEVTKKSLKLVVEATAEEVRTGLQQRLGSRDYDRTMAWIADDYNDFATQADVDRFISDAAAERDNFWQMPYARAAREAIFGLETGAGRNDDTPTGEEPIVPLDTVTPTGGLPPGHVEPRPNGGHAARNWDSRYGETHNPDGSPKADDEPEDPDATDPRRDQTAPPTTQDPETPPAAAEPETPPAAAEPETPPAAAEPETPPAAPAGGVDGPEGQQLGLDQIRQNLRRGSRGNGVIALQQRLGINADGIFGPQTEQAVRRFQQENNLQVDGIVGAQTLAALQGGSATGPGRIQAPAPTSSPRPQTRPQQNASKENTGNSLTEGVRIAELAGVNMKKQQLNEASVTINGAAEEIAELMRMMQLAGAPGAKPVDADDINPSPKPCPICGKVHGPMPKPGGCGGAPMQGPSEPSMGDMISMISKEEEDLDGDFQDASTEPDETYMNDVSASIPSGDDLHKEKDSYPATAGGDNPMRIKEQLLKALAEKKKAKPDYIDIDGDGDTEEPMKKAAKEKKSKGIQAMIDAGNKKADAEANEGYKLGKFKKRHKQKARFR